MIRYIGTDEMISILKVVGLGEMIRRISLAIKEDFCRWETFKRSARVAAYFPAGVVELMPTHDDSLYSFKYVNGHPENTARGKLSVTAFGVLARAETGYPILLSEMTICTALRTAATSALAAQVLANPDADTMALIGLGAQAEFQAIAFGSLVGIRNLRVYDIDVAAAGKFLSNAARLDLDVQLCSSVEHALSGAQIVTTATGSKRHASVIPPAAVVPGMHLNAIGGDCPGKTELHREILRRSKIFVEYLPQTRVEGELQLMESDYPAVELWKVLVGADRGREAVDTITLFDSVGFAVEDHATLRVLYEVSEQLGIYSELDLVPETTNSKDLFGLLADIP